MQDLDFAYFYKTYCYIFLMFYTLYLHFLDLWDVFMWTGVLGYYVVWQNEPNIRVLFCLTKRCQIQIIYRLTGGLYKYSV